MNAVAEHLLTCSTCPGLVRRRSTPHLAVTLGSLALAAGVIFVASHYMVRPALRREPSPLQKLAQAAAPKARTIEARLTDMPWAPYGANRQRSSRHIPNYALDAVLAEVAAGESSQNPDDLRAAAIAQAWRGQTGAASVTIALALQREPGDSRSWSDAAAITLTESLQSGHYDELPTALAQIDAALRHTPDLPQALFNRALILEHMGLHRHAVTAWSAYLRSDGTSLWADEARTHLQQLDQSTGSQEFRRERPDAEAAAKQNDTTAVQAFVGRHRQLSRAWCEVETLGLWAQSERNGDHIVAAEHLAFARAVGNALKNVSGESLLADAVRAIDAAAGPSRKSLIEAHVRYHQARLLLRQRDSAQAEPLFAQAAKSFQGGNSPMHGVALYYRALALYELESVVAARDLLLEIEERETYRALTGNLHWQLGMCLYILGDWSGAMGAYQRSVAAFDGLGETAHAAFLRILIADLYDNIGDREQAWRERVKGFRDLSDAGRESRLHISISGAARAELQDGRTENAAALLAVAGEEAKIAAGPESTVLSYASLAAVRAATDDGAGAAAALQEARTATAALTREVAARTTAAVDAAEASLLVDDDPERALQLLESAGAQYKREKRLAWLPGVHLQQGRALRRLGRDDEALRHLQTAIDIVEKHRASVSDADLRASVFNASEPLFHETIDLLVSRRAYDAAFELAERFRARTLLEELTLSPQGELPSLRPQLAPGVTVIEYVVLEHRLVGFALRADAVEAFVVEISRERLRTMVTRAASAVRSRQDVAAMQQITNALREILITPVAQKIKGSALIVFVPDAFLQQVPIAALYDTRKERYLIQDHAVAIAPSVRLLGHLTRAKRDAATVDALVIGNPSTGGELEPLPASETEARTIATMYGRSTLLVRDEATRERFFRDWGAAAVVHYAGHATSTASRGAAASLALAGRERADHVTAREVAKLSPPATRLVVLGACDSLGPGDEHLETTHTLAHAFLASGVPTVVGTLWPVGDEPSRELFRTFHRQWTPGDRNVATALREAQLALLMSSHAELRHPASWAGVVVLGDPTQRHSGVRGTQS